ncbi:MAG: hypothetical protein GX308_01475 [Epulopiscium sp.]|nr:hypothetical protein [Candidatus Epulonipiscium sp.]
MADLTNVNYINSNDSKIQYKKEDTAPKNEISKDAFLHLLVTQLRYQDPLNPTNDKEFLAQMAQFTTLEQMQNMNQNFEATKAFSLIGKEIQATIINEQTSDYEVIQGKVEFVKMRNGKPYLLVGNKEVPAEKVEIVTDSSILGITNEPTNAFELIGKVVQVQVKNPDTKKVEYVEGKVMHINMKKGVPYVVIGSGESAIEASLADLVSVVEKESLTGKRIKGTIFNSETTQNEAIEGIVEYILIRDNLMYAVVDGKELSIKDVVQVFEE